MGSAFIVRVGKISTDNSSREREAKLGKREIFGPFLSRLA